MDTIERFQIRVDDSVLEDLRDAPGTDALPGPDRRHGLGVRDPARLPARARRVLARRVRLAHAGGTTQRARALPHHHRRPVDPLHPRAVSARRRFAAAPHTRLAGFGRRVPRRHPTVDRARGSRGPRGRRLPRRRAVVARLRLLGADPHARLGRATHRSGVRRADASPRLHALRRAGRRLGRPGRDAESARSIPSTARRST